MAQWETPCGGTSKNDRLHLPLLFVWVSIGCSVCLSVCLLVSPSRYIFVGLSFLQYIFLACLLVYLNFFCMVSTIPLRDPSLFIPWKGEGG